MGVFSFRVGGIGAVSFLGVGPGFCCGILLGGGFFLGFHGYGG